MSDHLYHQALSANRKLLEENARLKAEVERLRKAGDEMATNIPRMVTCQVTAHEAVDFMNDWNAAKEGKPEEIEVGDIIYVNGTKCRVLWCDPTEYGMRLTASEDAYSKRAAKEGKPSV